MTIFAITLIHENISNKERAFNKKNRPYLEEHLVRLAENGILKDDELLAKINYVQNSTGFCDYIIQLEADNVEKLMRAINIIRQLEQVSETQTHIGQVLFKKD